MKKTKKYVIMKVGKILMNIRCDCGKLLCRYKEGYFYLYCKSCKEEKKIPINKIIVEPKSQD